MTSGSIPLRYSCILHHLWKTSYISTHATIYMLDYFRVLVKPTRFNVIARTVSECLETTEHHLRHFSPHCLQITRPSQTTPVQPANHESHIHQQTYQAVHHISRRSTHIPIQNSQNNTDPRSSTHATTHHDTLLPQHQIRPLHAPLPLHPRKHLHHHVFLRNKTIPYTPHRTLTSHVLQV